MLTFHRVSRIKTVVITIRYAATPLHELICANTVTTTVIYHEWPLPHKGLSLIYRVLGVSPYKPAMNKNFPTLLSIITDRLKLIWFLFSKSSGELMKLRRIWKQLRQKWNISAPGRAPKSTGVSWNRPKNGGIRWINCLENPGRPPPHSCQLPRTATFEKKTGYAAKNNPKLRGNGHL